MDRIELRVQRLERQNRFFKRYFALLLLLLSTLSFVIGFTSNRVPEEIVAHSIRVVGEEGRNSASLSATKDGWVALSFRDLKDTLRLSLLMTPSGKPTLAFFQNNRARLSIGTIAGSNGDECSIALLDPSGQILWQPSIPNPNR